MSKSLKIILLLIPFIVINLIMIIIILANTTFKTKSYSTIINYDSPTKASLEISEKEMEVSSLLDTETDYDRIIELLNEINESANEIKTYKRIEYVNISRKSLEGNLEKYNSYSTILNNYETWLNSFYNRIYDSNFKEQFFYGYSETDITYYLNVYSVKAKDLLDEINELKSSYDSSSYQLSNSFNTFYAKYATLQNKYAKILGYDNYFDYANDRIYFRDYDEEDIYTFAGYINKYVISRNGFYSTCYNTASQYSMFTSYDAKGLSSLAFHNYSDLISDYTTYLSEDIYDFYISYDEYIAEYVDSNSYSGAYTTYLPYYNTPIMYLGPSPYSSTFTFIHEFGHSVAYTSYKDYDESYDLCELQSQGNEMLFLSYLANSDIFNNRDIHYLVYNKMADFLQYEFYSGLIGYVEAKVYNSGDTITADMINSIINDAFSNVFTNTRYYFNENTVYNYLKNVVINNSMYYISYATSIINAIDLYISSLKNGIDNAKDTWLYLVYYENYDGYTNTITSAGLHNSFDESTFKYLDYYL